jgi:Predicted transcription factor, homolog of eukaryotic MBF1
MGKDLEIPAFGPVLRKYRLAAGLSQEELGARLGYETANYISCLEIGTRKPSVELLFKIAAALNVKAVELIGSMEDLHSS